MSNQTGDSKGYSVDMVCENCGAKERKTFPRGNAVPSKAECGNCGCRSMVKAFGGERNWMAKNIDVFLPISAREEKR